MIVLFRDINSILSKGSIAPQRFRIERCRKQYAALQQVVKDLGHETELFAANTDSSGGDVAQEGMLILPEVAVVVRPPGLHDALEQVAHVLARYRPIQRIGDGCSICGSDILTVGHHLYVALSRLTNAEGIAALREITEPFGYAVTPVEVHGEVSLRQACSYIPPHFLLLNQDWIDPNVFGNLSVIHVAPEESNGAPTVTLASVTLVSASFPETEKRLQAAGIMTRKVEILELEKAGENLARLCLLKEPRRARPSSVDHRSAAEALKVVDIPQVPSSGKAAQAIIHGGFAYVSAQLPFDPTAANVPQMSPEEQTEQVLRNVAIILHSVGASMADVLHATVHLADPKHLERIEAPYARMFAGHRPTRSVISNRALPSGVLVEIEVVAAAPKGRLP